MGNMEEGVQVSQFADASTEVTDPASFVRVSEICRMYSDVQLNNYYVTD